MGSEEPSQVCLLPHTLSIPPHSNVLFTRKISIEALLRENYHRITELNKFTKLYNIRNCKILQFVETRIKFNSFMHICKILI